MSEGSRNEEEISAKAAMVSLFAQQEIEANVVVQVKSQIPRKRTTVMRNKIIGGVHCYEGDF
jgi:hypothetical protein